MADVASTAVVVGVCALLAYWTIRPARPAAETPRTAQAVVGRARFVPVGTRRVATVAARGSGWAQRRRVRRLLAEHRARGWEPVHDPRPPLWPGDEWLLGFQKVR